MRKLISTAFILLLLCSTLSVFKTSAQAQGSGNSPSFTVLWCVPITDNMMFSADTGDVDGDGINDVAIIPGPGDWNNLPGTVNTLQVVKSDGITLWSKSVLIEGGIVGLADVDGDSRAEVFVGGTINAWSGIAIIYAFDDDGSQLWTFEGRRDPYGRVHALVFTDLDSDGKLDIAAGGTGWGAHYSYGVKGNTGGLLWESYGDSVNNAALGDVTGDGVEEILFFSTLGYRVQVLNKAGGLVWERFTDGYNLGTVGDVTGDGVNDVIVASPNKLCVYKNDGTLLWTKQFGDGVTQGNSPSVPVVVDVDGDNVKDLIFGADKQIYAYKHDGSSILWTFGEPGFFTESPQIYQLDIDRDAKMEFIFTQGREVYQLTLNGEARLIGLLPEQTFLPSPYYYYPVAIDKGLLVAGDVNNDGLKELIVAQIIDGQYYVAAIAPRIGADLPIPYENQGDGDTKWCGLASLAMVLRYYGVPIHVWDIARDLVHPASLGANLNVLWDYVSKFYPQFNKSMGKYWSFTEQIWSDIRSNLNSGYPVILSLSGVDHIIVVVGYNSTGFFVHDPSGALYKWIWKTTPDYTNMIHLFVKPEQLQPYIVTGLKSILFGTFLVIIGSPAPLKGTLWIGCGDYVYALDQQTLGRVFIKFDRGICWKPEKHAMRLDSRDIMYIWFVVFNHRGTMQSFHVQADIVGEDGITYLAFTKDVSVDPFSGSPVSQSLIRDIPLQSLGKTQKYLIKMTLLDSSWIEIESFSLPLISYVSL